jgi:hypothetical protein
VSTSTTLKGVDNIGDSLLSEQLECNALAFFSWGLLGIGGFFNVNIPQSGAYGGDFSRLRLSEDPNYSVGQVWEGFRKDWVWESGVEFTSQPTAISGVFVDGQYYNPADTGGYGHLVDYPNGRIIFASPIDSGSTVTCEYSYRLWQWYTQDVPWWEEIQFNSYRVDSPQFLQYGSGAWSILAENRVQLPAVIVEAVSRTDRKPFEIGSEAVTVRQDLLFHILAETPTDRKTMHDIITEQYQKRIQGFDKNLMFDADAYPLTADGAIASGAMCYPDLIQPTGDGGFFWTQIRFADTRSVDQGRILPFYWATVRAVMEVDIA